MTRRRGLPVPVVAVLVVAMLYPAVAAAQPPSARPPSSSEAPTTDESGQLVHHRVGRLGLDHPVDWIIRPSGLHLRHLTVIEFIGTAPSAAACTEVGNGMHCEVDLALEPGTVSILIGELGGPPGLQDMFERVKDPPPGASVVTIDGVPALLTR
jgi:hypothetical protein